MYPSLSRKARENSVLRFQKHPHPPKRITPPPAAAAFAGKQPASAFCYASRSIFPLRAKLLPMLTEDALHELFATNHQAVAEVAHTELHEFLSRELALSLQHSPHLPGSHATSYHLRLIGILDLPRMAVEQFSIGFSPPALSQPLTGFAVSLLIARCALRLPLSASA